MPTYDYLCQECGKPFEMRLSIAEYSERKSSPCPHCGSPTVVRRFTPVNLATGSRAVAGPATGCDPTSSSCCCG